MSKKVLLLYGGFSAEREVSVSSKEDITKALKSKGYTVIEHDLKDIWRLIDVLRIEKPDVVYNGLYGNWGEDGEVQAFLDMLEIPYTHSQSKASMLGMDKNLTKMLVERAGVKVAKGEKLLAKEYMKSGSSISYPHVVKPVSDGSSVGVYIVKNDNDKAKVFYDDENIDVLVEEFIDGRELTAMCLEGKSYVVTELKAKNEFYDYEAKYTTGMTQHILPADIPEEVKNTCLKYAEIAHKTLGCSVVSRSDFRYNIKDGVVFLEINTNPGMTSLSLVPEQAKYIGLSFADLCDKLVQNATYRQR